MTALATAAATAVDGLAAAGDALVVLARRLADRSKLRSEATIQADVRQLLLSSGLNLDEHELDVQLETQVGDRRRIDVEVGYTVIEVKKDLRSEAVAAAARVQLGGYVATREAQSGQRYLGVLTDGALWRAYQLHEGALCAILNSPTLTDLVRPLMSYGKDERDIDKAMWRLLIPAYDPADSDHQRLATLGADCAALVAKLDLDEAGNFIILRRRVRTALAASTTGQAIDEMVQELLA